MEIHAPEEPVRTWMDLAVHLAIVTAGILIALGLEGVVEAYRHRELAEEARANIRAEMQANRQKVAELMNGIPKLQQEQMKVVQYLDNVLAHKPNQGNELRLSWTLRPILDTSWTTAQSVGALSFMPYEEVKEYAQVYELQAVLVSVARRGQEQTSLAIGFFGQDAPDTLPEWQLKNEVAQVQQAYGLMVAQQQLGKGLVSEYDEVLNRKKF